MLAIDTNVLVRLLVRDHADDARVADEAIAKGAWISQVVLVEAIWALDSVYGRSAKQLVSALQLLLLHETLVLQDAETVTAALVHYKTKPGLGFSDCLIPETARKAGPLPLATFDRSLAKATGARKLRSSR